MSATAEALKRALPPMEGAAPMAQGGVEAEGLLAQADKQVAYHTMKLAEQVPVLLRSGHDSKRRALLKAIEILTSEFPPAEAGDDTSDQVKAAATGQAPNPGANMIAGAQPQPGAGNGNANQPPVQA